MELNLPNDFYSKLYIFELSEQAIKLNGWTKYKYIHEKDLYRYEQKFRVVWQHSTRVWCKSPGEKYAMVLKDMRKNGLKRSDWDTLNEHLVAVLSGDDLARPK